MDRRARRVVGVVLVLLGIAYTLTIGFPQLHGVIGVQISDAFVLPELALVG